MVSGESVWAWGGGGVSVRCEVLESWCVVSGVCGVLCVCE